jgi:hypothetical protein
VRTKIERENRRMIQYRARKAKLKEEIGRNAAAANNIFLKKEN